MSTGASVIQLAPASAAFVANRTTSLGPWVLGGFVDSVLLGVIFCQVLTFSRTRTPAKTTLQQYYNYLVLTVLGLSMIKTAQCIAVVWVQNVLDFANPDKARTLVAEAWWQVSMPLMTAVIGTTVQSFFCLRFYMLSRNWMLCVPIICAMCLGLAGVCLSLAAILAGNAKAKVMWLLVHLVGVFIADFLITSGTIYSLRKRNSGLQRTTVLINRLLRLVFESAIPPTIIATIDLIMTQTLGAKLLWHMLLNITLGKVYVVSLMYTLNSINEYRGREHGSQEVYSYNTGRTSRRTNLELNPRSPVKSDPQIFVQTQVSTHVSPGPFSATHTHDVAYVHGEYKERVSPSHSRDDDSSDVRYAQ